MKILIVVPVLAMLFLMSCGVDSPVQRIAARNRADLSNIERGKIGLRQIGSQWICFRSNNRLDEWIINKNGTTSDKAVKYDSEGQILWEEDSYLSGRAVLVDGQTTQEQLVVYFDYNTRQAKLDYRGIDPVVNGIVDAASGEKYLDVLAAAELILKRWGIPRL